jgi:hypothetical protein
MPAASIAILLPGAYNGLGGLVLDTIRDLYGTLVALIVTILARLCRKKARWLRDPGKEPHKARKTLEKQAVGRCLPVAHKSV